MLLSNEYMGSQIIEVQTAPVDYTPDNAGAARKLQHANSIGAGLSVRQQANDQAGKPGNKKPGK